MKVLIDIVLNLARQNMAFRGHREHWKNAMRGNFLDLVTLLCLYSPQLAAYVSKLNSLQKRTTCSFLTWFRQNQLLEALSEYLQEKIVEEVKQSPFFSLEMDTTFDMFKHERLTMIVRYANQQAGKVKERLLAVRNTPSTTGENLFLEFEKICEGFGLDFVGYLVALSAHGAANMRGDYLGVQARIRELCPQALYIWCYAHRLNLIIVDAVESCQDAKNLFGTLEHLYVFLGTKERNDLFEKFQEKRYPKQPKRRLKRVSTTRWTSHSDSLDVVLDRYDALLDILEHIKEKGDRSASVEASGLLDRLISKNFILTAMCFKRIIDIITPLSKTLQKADMDLVGVAADIERVTKVVSDLRTDEEFQTQLAKMEEHIEAHGIEDIATPIAEHRKRRTKKMPGEGCSDERIDAPVQAFKVNTFYRVNDIVLTQIRERFGNEPSHLLGSLFVYSSPDERSSRKSRVPTH